MLYLCLSKHHSSPSSIVYFTEDTTLQTFFATIDPTKQYTYVTTYKVLNQCPHHLTLTQLHIHTNDTIIVQKENTTPFVLPPTAIQVRLKTEDVQEYQTAMIFKNTTIHEFFYTFDYEENFNYYLDEMWHLNDATYQDFTFQQLGLKEGLTITIEKKMTRLGLRLGCQRKTTPKQKMKLIQMAGVTSNPPKQKQLHGVGEHLRRKRKGVTERKARTRKGLKQLNKFSVFRKYMFHL